MTITPPPPRSFRTPATHGPVAVTLSLPLPSSAGWASGGVKAVADVVAAAVLLVLAAPVIAVVALAVRLTSRGPAFYSQDRVGRGGRVFRIYKVRTMYHDCERASGARWATPGDPRVTAVGRVLRRTHLDELPQLWNVLRGEMSLVGPRPERPEFVDRLAREIPGYHARHAVRPGVTGLAQVQLPPDTDLNSVRRKLGYDHYYINHRTAWLDVRLVLATALKMLHVPFAVAKLAFRIPGRDAVEHAPAAGRPRP
jgi:lipopolysaccharide/colanic/teichoic acid biosynthesis glycosyltransferase